MSKHAANPVRRGRRRAESGLYGSHPGQLTDAGPGYAGYIGRVGALAVALGVGMAVASGFGTGFAYAQDGDTGTSDNPAVNPSGPAPGGPAEPPTGGSGGADVDAEEEGDPSDTGMNSDSSGGADDSLNDAGQSTDANEDGDEADVGGGAEAQVTPASADPGAGDSLVADDPEAAEVLAAIKGSARQRDSGASSPAGLLKTGVNRLAGALDPDEVGSAAIQAVVPMQARLASSTSGDVDRQSLTANAKNSALNSLVATSSAPTENPVTGLPAAMVDIATSLVGAFLSPLLSPAPGAPLDPPMMWVMLAAARRQIGSLFGVSEPAGTETLNSLAAAEANTAPVVAASSSITDAATGVVTVKAVVRDAEDDPLTVTVSQPAGNTGTVGSVSAPTYDAGTDTYTYTATYTPTQAARLRAGLSGPQSDTVSITVSDGVNAPVTTIPVAISPAHLALIDTDPAAAGVNGITNVAPSQYGIAIHPGGDFAYVANIEQGVVSVIDTNTNTLIDTNPGVAGVQGIAVGGNPVGIAFSPDGDIAYISRNTSGTVTVINTANHTIIDADPAVAGIQEIAVGPGPVGVAFSPDGGFAYVATRDGVSVINTANHTLIDADPGTAGVQPITVGPGPSDLKFSPDGDVAYVTNSGGNTVSVINTANHTRIDTDPVAAGVNDLVVGTGPFSVAFSPTRDRAYVANYDDGTVPGTVAVIDTTTHTLVDTDSAAAGVNPISIPGAAAVAVSPDGSLVYIGSFDTGRVWVIDAATNTLVDVDPNTAGVNGLAAGANLVSAAVTPDGVLYATQRNNGTTSVLSVISNGGPSGNPVVARNDTATTTVDTVKSGNVLTNDIAQNPDGTGEALTVTTTGTSATAAGGSVTMAANGAYTYTPAVNFTGTDSFTYTVTDTTSYATGLVSITVSPVNHAPTAVADNGGTVSPNTAKTFTAAQLTDNDTDPDVGDTLSVNSVGGATNGTVKLNADGSVTFTPTTGYSGPASFVYRVKDAAGAVSANTAKVSLTVGNGAPTAVNDTGTAAEDTAKVFTAAQLTGNDTDPNAGDTLSVASVAGATNGAVTLNGDGTVTFTPTANYSGPASFTYKVKDAAGAVSANSATVSVTVSAVNDAPTAVADSGGTVSVNTAKTLTAAQLTGNDTDPDVGDTLSVNSVGGATNGTVKLNGDGSVTFTPTTGYSGPASFVYRVKDAAGAVSANTAKVSLTVGNAAPTAVNDTGTAAEDTAKTFTAAELVGNDTDPNAGDTLSVASVAGATNGAVTLNGDGTVTFTPTANYSGPASFTYKVKDAAGAVSANSATVSVTVSAVNDAPTAVADSGGTVSVNTAKTLTAAQLTGNDTDPDVGDTLSVNSVGGATNGTVKLNADGSVTFTPTTGYSGPASFVYRVKDAAGAVSANTAKVSLTVGNGAPTAVNDTGTAAEDTAKVFTAAQLTGNDTDPNAGDTLSVASVAGATNGAVTLNGDGTVTFTPTANYSGPASFTYKVKDAAGAVSANSATVSVTVSAVNDAPTAVADSGGTVSVNTAKTLTAAQLTGNDTDPDVGDTLSVNSVGGATNGTVKLNGDGSVTFTPTTGYSGPASFVYRVKDAAGAVSANTAKVSLTVGNAAPTAVNDTGTAAEDTAKTFTAAELVGNDTDPNAGDTLSVASVAGATNGAVTLNGDGTVTFTPTANYSGPASFTYKVKDAAGAVSANSATVSVTVSAVNDAPTAVADSGGTVSVNTAKTLTAAQLTGNDTDPDVGDTLSVNSVGGATNGTVKLNGDGTVTFTPTTGYTGAASFIYRVKDAAGAVSANTAKVSLTVS